MFYDAVRNDHGFAIDPFKALVARPIGWVSTQSTMGAANLAPYSFFNIVSQAPHYIVLGSSGYKDTLRNIVETGEFVVNIATLALREQMNASSATLPPHVDEFEFARLSKAHSQLVKAPRVAESPACLECLRHQVLELPDERGAIDNWLVVGRVIGVHIDDRYISDGRVDSAAMNMIIRLGYSDYATVAESWRLRRPD
jgi:flavin reductase (DIM6/NTAB) family NADH-FMN oxidoreductase RutF